MLFLKILACIPLAYILIAVVLRYTYLAHADEPWAMAFKWPILLLFMFFGNVQ